MPDQLRLIAASAFGLESVVKHELRALGFDPSITSPGKIEFAAPPSGVPKANVWLRSASRVLVELDSFRAVDFDELYESVSSVPWSDVVPAGSAIGVRAKTTRSTINSPRSTQSIVKRAIVDAIAGRQASLDESGPTVTIDVSIVADHVTIAVDTTGPGLHKRGYRPRSGPGQLKENLAAGIVQLTRWQPDRPLIDPFCGHGTIVIEAAMLGAGFAPGATREFAGEHLHWIDSSHWDSVRADARSVEPPRGMAPILGRDVNDAAVGEARRAAERAGVRGLVGFRTGDYHEVTRAAQRGWIVTNPPYGLRVLDEPEARQIHADLPAVLAQLPGWSHAILTAFPGFESLIRQTATRRRKLYNGSIECGLYVFLPSRPTKTPEAKAEARDAAALPIPTPAHAPATAAGDRKPAFGDTSDRDQIAESFRVTLAKRIRHLRRWPDRNIEAFRIYDGQTPGASVFVDRIGSALRVTNRPKRSDRPVGEEDAWLERLVSIVAETAACPRQSIAVLPTERPTGPSSQRVREGALELQMDPSQPLRSPPIDGRVIRTVLAEWSVDRRVLHIGAVDPGSWQASLAAGPAAMGLVEPDPDQAGHASAYLTRSGLEPPRVVTEHPEEWANRGHHRTDWDLIAVQLPAVPEWATLNDPGRPAAVVVLGGLLPALRAMLAPGGRLLLVTRGSRGDPTKELTGWAGIRETTRRTVPEDYSHSKPHRSWLLTAEG